MDAELVQRTERIGKRFSQLSSSLDYASKAGEIKQIEDQMGEVVALGSNPRLGLHVDSC